MIAHFWNKAQIEETYGRNWELLKFEIGKYLRKYGKDLAKSRREHETKVISEITSLSGRAPDNLSIEEKLKLTELQKNLDDIYNLKAEGAFVRSRLKWLEEGEQMSAYFFKLEKTQAKYSAMLELNIHGAVTDDRRSISHFCYKYFSSLYKSKLKEDCLISFFNNLGLTNTLTEDEKLICDAPITQEEVLSVISQLKSNRSPGVDGITAEFYREFAELLAPFLFKVFSESVANKILPVTLTQGLITLIPKPKKDLLFIDNWRPITLLNNDYKLFALIFAQRFKKVLDSIIDENQSGFMSNRHIFNNIRLVLDLIDYSYLIKEDSFIFFLDFFKAFDTVEHSFIFKSLHKFGFGPYFCDAMKTLYAGGNSSVKLSDGTTQRFNLERGVRQGCPVSVYLLLVTAQMFCHHIKSGKLEGISIADKNIILSQLADDTAIFLKDALQVKPAINLIDILSKASGLHLNLNKCELFALKNCDITSIDNIRVKSQINYLGIVITKNQQERCLLNFDPRIKKAKNKFNLWLQRDLSLKGRALLSKAEGISRLVYAASSLAVDSKTLKTIDQILFNFLWKNRTHYIRKSVVLNTCKNGGLNFLDFSTLNCIFKINWLKYFLKNDATMWNFIPKFVFNNIGGLPFLLVCNYQTNKIPLKLSEYHKQALLSWKLAFKHNFSPHRYYIWNNGDILHNRKSVFLQNWVDKNILIVPQLMSPEGHLLGHHEFCEKYSTGLPKRI